jgi:hypothetical protein
MGSFEANSPMIDSHDEITIGLGTRFIEACNRPTSEDVSMLDCGKLEPSDAELSQVMVDVLVHENGPLLRLERPKERMWVLGAAS